ncbi:hypothetical protein Tco_0707342 [Tanacetum coccineum]|uniref:Uncharacterized protein n=1 Tax=Tanacetum coccineum TaxID=301880 RepID=A0ABQ4YA23_9ASTR
MSPPARASRAKFRWGIAFVTGLKHFTNPVTKLEMKHTNRNCRIPQGLHPHQIEEKLIKINVGGEWIIEREMKISKDGTIYKFPDYHSSEEEEPTEQPISLNKYGSDDDELERNEADADEEEEEEEQMEEEVKYNNPQFSSM